MDTPGRTRLCLQGLCTFAVLVAAGCGGGGGDSATPPAAPPPPAPPGVSGVSVSSVRYGQAARFDVTGTGLDQLSLTLASSACRAAPVATGSVTATQASFTCVLGTTGGSSAVVSSSGTAVLTQAYTVPQPQVTLTVAGGVTGDIVVGLDPAKTPITVDNFLSYVNSGFYAGTLFHRVERGFVVQGGGYTSVRPTLALKPTGAPIKLEADKGLSNLQGTIAMARATGADTATSQFFINLVDNSSVLDATSTFPGYAVFGSVVGGISVVNTLAGVSCSTAVAGLVGLCVPNTDIVITAATQTQ